MLRESSTEKVHAMRRSITFALAAAMLFVLLQTNLAPKISMGPLEFLRSSPLSIFLTSVVAFLFLDAAIKSSELARQHSAFRYSFKCWNEKANQDDLDTLVIADMPIYFGFNIPRPGSDTATIEDRLYEIAVASLIIAVMCVPLLFQVYSFWTMFSSFGYGNALVWINLGLVAPLLVFGYLILLISKGE